MSFFSGILHCLPTKPVVPNLFFKGATTTQWNMFRGRNQQFKLIWCTVSPVVFY